MDFKSLWVERYRPKTLDDLCISQKIKDKVIEYGNEKEIPHLLLVGPCGVGKTTIAQIIVQDILKCDYLYINASDESGIDTIRQKVTGFVQTKSFDGGIKVVILDEYDGSSAENQRCLRNLMESYAKHARFIITGNFKYKIITAINSRCKSIDIKPILADSFKRLLYILEKEGISSSVEEKKKLGKLLKKNFPDIRKTIIEMQDFCYNGVLEIDETVNTSELCAKIVKDIDSGATIALRKYLIEHDGLFNNNHEQLLVDLLNFLYVSKVEDSKKKGMIMTIADHLHKMAFVNDKEINFFACILNLENV